MERTLGARFERPVHGQRMRPSPFVGDADISSSRGKPGKRTIFPLAGGDVTK